MLLNRKLSKQSPAVYILLRLFFLYFRFVKKSDVDVSVCVSFTHSLRDAETINNGKVITRQTTYIANIFSVTDTVRPKTANEQNRNYDDRNMSALLSCISQHTSAHTHTHICACAHSFASYTHGRSYNDYAHISKQLFHFQGYASFGDNSIYWCS